MQHNNKVTEDLKEMFSDIELLESHVPGMYARNCIIAAMHFDFHTAMTQSNFSDPQQKYREEATNIQILNNILKNLKEIKNTQANGVISEQQLKDKL